MAIALSYRWGTGQSPSPVDGHSLLPGRGIALVVFIITPMGDRHEVAAPVDGRSIIVQMGEGQSPSPVDGHSLLPGRSLALVVFIIAQLRDRHEVATLVDGHSIIVQMGDGALPRPPSVPQIRL